jgi:hypothetical protein
VSSKMVYDPQRRRYVRKFVLCTDLECVTCPKAPTCDLLSKHAQDMHREARRVKNV